MIVSRLSILSLDNDAHFIYFQSLLIDTDTGCTRTGRRGDGMEKEASVVLNGVSWRGQKPISHLRAARLSSACGPCRLLVLPRSSIKFIVGKSLELSFLLS